MNCIRQAPVVDALQTPRFTVGVMTHNTSPTRLDRTLRTACAAFASIGLILAAVGCGSAEPDAVQSSGARATYSYEHDSHIVETSSVTHDPSADHDSRING